MIARGSMRMLGFLFKVGYEAGLHPWRWDDQAYRLLVSNQHYYNQFLKFSIKFQILIRLITIIYILLWTSIFGRDLSALELLFYLTLTVMETCTIAYLHMWSRTGQVWTNSLLFFNHKMLKFFHVPECPFYKDGVEGFIMFMLTIIPLAGAGLIGCVTICLTHYDVKILRIFTSFLNSSPMALAVGVSGMSCALATDLFIATRLIFLAVIHITTLSNWVDNLKWTNPMLRRRDFRRTLRTYRAIYILHDLTNIELIERVVPISIFAATGILTSSLFMCFARFEDPLVFMFRIIAFTSFCGTFYVLNNFLNLCCGMKSTSKEFITTIRQPQFARNKFIKLHVKSCQPFTWNASPFVINKFTIFQILANVINIVITLVLNQH